MGEEKEDERELRVAALADEYLEALRQHRAVDMETFLAAHPDEADDLREILPLMADLEGVSSEVRPVAANLLAAPERLGGYRILERIGTGGMGAVFRALQESLNREVAIKILSPAWNADVNHCAAFEQEACVIARLRHTNIVEVFGSGREGDYRYYVMSLVHGQGVTPRRLAQAYPGVPYEQAVARIGLQAAEALAFAHSQHVLHRDIKPGNLLLDDDGVLHVGDFGLATVLNSGESAPLVTESHAGTLRYMAPERLTKGESSFAVDIYGLGLTLYELLTKKACFTEVEPGALIRRICAGPIEPLRGEGELGAIINKAVSYDPSDRYPSMQAMSDDLKRYLSGRPVTARRASLWRRYNMWMHRRPYVAFWSHVAASLILLLTGSILWGYHNDRVQRKKTEDVLDTANTALQEVVAGMVGHYSSPSRQHAVSAEAEMMEKIFSYYWVLSQLKGGSSEQFAHDLSLAPSILLRTGEVESAAHLYEISSAMSKDKGCDYIRSVAGVILARTMQGRYKETEKTFESLLHRYRQSEDTEERFELACACAAVASELHRRYVSSRSVRFEDRLAFDSALSLLRGLMEKTSNRSLQNAAYKRCITILFRMLLDVDAPKEQWKAISDLLPQGVTPVGLLAGSSRENDPVLRSLYVQLVLLDFWPNEDQDVLRAAVEEAEDLLAVRPGDAELISCFLRARDRADVVERGDAATVNEGTLAVLDFSLRHMESSGLSKSALRGRVESVLSDLSLEKKTWYAEAQRAAEVSRLRKFLEKYGENVRAKGKNAKSAPERR